MGWAYHFIDLTQVQLHQRRQLLDWYGIVAQISILIPLALLQLSFLGFWVWHKLQSRPDGTVPSSPHAKHQHNSSNLASVSVYLRRLQWWFGDDVSLFGWHVGTKGEIVLAELWTFWLLLCCFLQTGDDYLHLTKRFGIVASSQLPLQYLLAMKFPYSPISFFTRRSHESLNSAHQILGRIVTALLYLHTAFYLNFYVQKHLLPAKLKEAYVICGIVGAVAFTIVGTTALAPVRRWSYRLFYVLHVSLSTALLPILWFHVHHVRPYLIETAVIVIINAGLRWWATISCQANIRFLEGTALLDIRLTIDTPHKERKLTTWQPGQHAYLSTKGHPILRAFASNPFTLASLPTEDGQLRFVARVMDGNTAKLARSIDLSPQISIEGPYGLRSHPYQLLHYDRVLFVAGGIGATFVVPLYRQLLSDLSPGKGSYRRQKVTLVWVARHLSEITWAFPEGSNERDGFLERLEIYLTKDADIDARGPQHAQSPRAENDPQIGELEDGIELEEQKQLLDNSDNPANSAPDPLPTRIAKGRPRLERIVWQTFSHGPCEKVAVIACGPPSLNQNLRHELKTWVEKGRDVWFWSENFSL
ncbi:hypothetical protein K431DRAFT_277792 [Polychaeton citri CBS 116435]|uniref:ferric-chelate reductase (NADPH) n=1 Tax=Polychaeton citri CBS 116435 TaxID=1314669 RepID=A0A9P4Q2W6_9PEZI|nr:hypothetical protein K431DRAFT_277792 [Polychaeton citri CBS 116435]